MTDVSDADRAKAAEVVSADLIAGVLDSVLGDQLRSRAIDLAAHQVALTIATALAEARAPYDRLTADLRALAEELERESAEAARLAQKWAQSSGAQESLRASSLARRDAAARLRAVAAAAEEAKA